ncbi:serine protease [Bosea caraganae]|uniref:Serine protease n=1 Tax=Bosea caraganae TaxID=2763117 RepID=A0A370L5T7_9HYPH|nr:serine protease [Bosea caraganae]RDJ23360.1 serine protease [Bosea caraganae]RDJ24528.1 serine protease [Bosea caraganae]
MPDFAGGNPVGIPAAMEQAIRSICAIENAGPRDGTGFLISKDYVLTNYHVVSALIEAQHDDAARAAAFEAAECRFDYVTPGSGGHAMLGETVRIAEVVTSREPAPGDILPGGDFPPTHLDYAVIRIARKMGELPAADGRQRGWIPLSARATVPVAGEDVWILQHPWGEGWTRVQQSLIYADGMIVDGAAAGGRRVVHNASTRVGSSGSPCFAVNRGFALVALHNWGNGAGEGRAIPILLIANDLRGHPLAHLILDIPLPARNTRPNPINVTSRKQAALCLMDRSDPENDLIVAVNGELRWSPPGDDLPLVHVIVCKESDGQEYFADRLQHLIFNGPAERRDTKRIGALKRRLTPPTRNVSAPRWPKLEGAASGRHERRLRRLQNELLQLEAQGSHLLILQTSIDIEWAAETERQLIEAFAKKVSDRFSGSPDKIQVIVIFMTPDDDAGRRLGEAFENLWCVGQAPPHCGVCLRFEDIDRDDLHEWREQLEQAWGENAAFATALRASFNASRTRPLAEVAKELDESLVAYINSAVDDPNPAGEQMR